MALGEGAQRAAILAADADPVLGCDLEEIDRVLLRDSRILQRAEQGPPQAESCAMNRARTHGTNQIEPPQLPSAPFFLSPPQEPSAPFFFAPPPSMIACMAFS